MTAKPIRNVPYAIDLLLKGELFVQIEPRFEFNKDAAKTGFYLAMGASQCAVFLGAKTKAEQIELLVDYLQKF
jgi:hypothetical protein